MNIRRLVPADATAFQALRLASLQDAAAAFGSSYAEEFENPISAIESRLAVRPDRGVFGAFDNGTLIGMVGLGRENLHNLSHKGFIWGMYVRPSYRRRGIARELLITALTFAESVSDIRQLNLCVNATGQAAIELYKSVGFTTYGVEPEAMLIQGTLFDELHMRLPLVAR